MQTTANSSEVYVHFTVKSMNLSDWQREGVRMLQNCTALDEMMIGDSREERD